MLSPHSTRIPAATAAAVGDTAWPGPDEPGYEWRREQLLEQGGEWPVRIPAAELAELDAARDRNQETMAAVQYPGRVPLPVTASRCGRCGYLTTAAGHQVTCDE